MATVGGGLHGNAAYLSSMIIDYYDRRLLERLTPQLMFKQFGVPKPLPKNEGDSVIWHRWNLFTKGRLLSESAVDQARGISATKVSAMLMIIGDHAIITTYIDMIAINSVVEGAIDLFADSAALTIDFAIGRRLLWKLTSVSATLEVSATSKYLGGANYISSRKKVCACSSTKWQAPLWCIDDLASRNHDLSIVNGGSVATAITPNVLRSLVLKLKVKNAQPFDDGYFKMITHPDLVNQLRSSSAFIDMYKYTQTAVFEEGKIAKGGERGLVGVLEKVKIYESTEAPMAANSMATAHSAHGYGRYYFSFLFGKNSYGITDFDGGLHTYVKTPGPNSTNDPLNQWSTAGYKTIFAAKILNPSACLWLLSGKPNVVG